MADSSSRQPGSEAERGHITNSLDVVFAQPIHGNRDVPGFRGFDGDGLRLGVVADKASFDECSPVRVFPLSVLGQFMPCLPLFCTAVSGWLFSNS